MRRPKGSVSLWLERLRLWKKNMSTRIEYKTQNMRRFEKRLEEKHFIRSEELLKHPYKVEFTLGGKHYITVPSVIMSAKYPILYPKLFKGLLIYTYPKKEAYDMLKRLGNKYGFHELLSLRRVKGKSRSYNKTIRELREDFTSQQKILRNYIIISHEISKNVYPPEVVETMIKELGGVPTAFFLKKFRYARR